MTGIGDELERDVDALALTAGEDLLLGLADLEVAARASRPRSLQRLLDARVDLLAPSSRAGGGTRAEYFTASKTVSSGWTMSSCGT